MSASAPERSNGDGGSRQRLFFAVWPPQDLRLRLHALARQSLPPGQGRLISPNNIHLTLAFLGPRDAAGRACIEQAADRVPVAGFTLALDNLGYWRRSGILWAGADAEPPELLALVARLNQALAECGYAAETRPFRTHLTLARNVRRYPGIGRGGKAAARLRRERVDAIAPMSWAVDSYTLVASDTLASGARYEVLRTWGAGQ